MRKIKQASKQKLNRLYEKYKIWLHAMSKSELTGTEIALAHIKIVELKKCFRLLYKKINGNFDISNIYIVYLQHLWTHTKCRNVKAKIHLCSSRR